MRHIQIDLAFERVREERGQVEREEENKVVITKGQQGLNQGNGKAIEEEAETTSLEDSHPGDELNCDLLDTKLEKLVVREENLNWGEERTGTPF